MTYHFAYHNGFRSIALRSIHCRGTIAVAIRCRTCCCQHGMSRTAGRHTAALLLDLAHQTLHGCGCSSVREAVSAGSRGRTVVSTAVVQDAMFVVSTSYRAA